jgi:peptidoglycan/LPS O-acetylase OafA/YrhL
VIVFIGLTVLASEFNWAHRLQEFGKARLREWVEWLGRQGWPVRILVGVATFSFAGAIVYAFVVWSGVPGWVPDPLVPPLPGL